MKSDEIELLRSDCGGRSSVESMTKIIISTRCQPSSHVLDAFCLTEFYFQVGADCEYPCEDLKI